MTERQIRVVHTTDKREIPVAQYVAEKETPGHIAFLLISAGIAILCFNFMGQGQPTVMCTVVGFGLIAVGSFVWYVRGWYKINHLNLSHVDVIPYRVWKEHRALRKKAAEGTEKFVETQPPKGA